MPWRVQKSGIDIASGGALTARSARFALTVIFSVVMACPFEMRFDWAKFGDGGKDAKDGVLKSVSAVKTSCGFMAGYDVSDRAIRRHVEAEHRIETGIKKSG